MVLIKDTFSSLDMSKGLPIVLGDDSLTDSLGKGRIDLDHGSFNNVLYVPGLTYNLLSMYQMKHIGSPARSCSHLMMLKSLIFQMVKS